MHGSSRDEDERDAVAALLERLGDPEAAALAPLSEIEARRQRVLRLLDLVEELRTQPVPRTPEQRRPPDEAWTPSP